MSNKSAREERAQRAAAALVEQRRRERRRTILSITSVVVVMVLIVAAGFLLSRNRGGGPNEAAAKPGSGVRATIGRESAPHSVVIWEDFLCPFCGELEKQTADRLATAADQGRVRVTYRPFHLLDPDYSQQSLEVFAATQDSAGNDVAKKLHDLLYAHQPSETGPFPSQADIVDLAVQAGADRTAVQQAIDSGDATAAADESTKAAEDAGVRSTPTVLLDGDVVTGRTVDDIATSLLQSISQ
jgi:protein-disulfide isomerase